MEELTGPLEEVFKDFKRQWKEFQQAEPLLDVIRGFAAAIDWREPWIIGILVFHGVMLLAALFGRRSGPVQLAVFMVAACIVYVTEHLNRLGAQHWPRFATQNYFDRTGVFMTAVVSAPLLLAMFIVLINYLISCCAMLVAAKKKELMYKARQKAKAAKQNGAAAGSGSGAGAGASSGGQKAKVDAATGGGSKKDR